MKAALLVVACVAVLAGSTVGAVAVPAWPHGDPNVVVRSILAQPAFRHAPPNSSAAPSLIERILDWIGDVVHRFFGRLNAGRDVTNAIAGFAWIVSMAFVAPVIALALGLLALVAFRLVLRAVRGRGAAAGDATQLPPDGPPSAARLRDMALAAAQRGEYAQAVALLFAAALLALDERELVAYDGARTPGEYRRLVRAGVATCAAAFDELTLRFVRASYAQSPTSREDFEATIRAFGTFSALASAA